MSVANLLSAGTSQVSDSLHGIQILKVDWQFVLNKEAELALLTSRTHLFFCYVVVESHESLS